MYKSLNENEKNPDTFELIFLCISLYYVQKAASLVVSLTVFNKMHKAGSQLHMWNHTEDQRLKEIGCNCSQNLEGIMFFTFKIPPENEYPSTLTPA